MSAPCDAFAATYGVELLYESEPGLDPDALLQAIQLHSPSAELLDKSGKKNLLSFIHPDYLVHLADATLPAQTFIGPSSRPVEIDEAWTEALQQSWNFPEARERLAKCRHAVLMTDLMSSSLDHRDRLRLIQKTLAGVLSVAPPLAIHWQPTRQIIDPARFLLAFKQGDAPCFFQGGLNVRFYNISNTPGDMLMDTLGLSALGLTDLQCHFRGLDPGQVAGCLANLAYYLFENGDVIASGHTVQGITPGSKWRCQHEDSMLRPNRVVLDINPGPPHAAGGRNAG